MSDQGGSPVPGAGGETMSDERVREIAETHGRWREVTLDRDESQEVAALAREVLAARLSRSTVEPEGPQLRAFVRWVLDQHTGTIEGCDIEEKAVELGLMTVTEVTEPCGEGCACSDYGFPATCYRPAVPSEQGGAE
jgi:hypothetical protein